MRIGILSDTHSRYATVARALVALRERGVDWVLHCGDIEDAETVALFRGLTTHFVFGNCDDDADELRAAIEQAGMACYGQFGNLELGGRRVALLHSHDAKLFRQVCTSGDYDLVCYGHTHHAEQRRNGKTLILNPGALFRATPHSIATVDLATMEAMIVPL